MRFLLTNDDGIYARGLGALSPGAVEGCRLHRGGPRGGAERRGARHYHFEAAHGPAGQETASSWAGPWRTPTGFCVKIGLRELTDKPVDLVVSGINLGANVGINVLYSGTVSAATEGAILEVPSIAISLGTHSRDADFSFAARFARNVAQFMLHHDPNRHVPLNVNVPAIPEDQIQGVAVTPGQARLIEQFERRSIPGRMSTTGSRGNSGHRTDADGTDFIALQDGMMSITPIYYDMTRYDALEELRGRDRDRLRPWTRMNE